MQLLVCCERSGVVRRAFRDRGIDAWSVDLAASEDDSPYHIIGDAIETIRKHRPGAVIAHPECKRLCLSGVLRLYRDGKKANGLHPARWAEMIAAAKFFGAFFDVHKGKLCVENPTQHGYAAAFHGIRWQPQRIQPHQFGDDASKATCLWLRGLPTLMASHIDSDFFAAAPPQPRRINGLPRYANQTDSGQNKLAPSATRSIQRARTYEGIAKAMSEQWGPLL